jgi:electron transport complex protein RnfB
MKKSKNESNQTDNASEKKDVSRRDFMRLGGRLAAGGVLGGIAWRALAGTDPEFELEQPGVRYAWQIDPEKCSFCGKCASACVRQPSAVKAVNDQKKCSYCVICYGHISNKEIDSVKVETDGHKVCPVDAVRRHNYSGGPDGYFTYTIDHERCIGCGECAHACNGHGSKSLFLIIRPDLCLGCNQCQIALECPENAITRLPQEPADNFRGIYGLDEFMMGLEGAM